MMDHMNDVPDVGISNIEQIPDSQNSQSEHEISQNYEGAPEMVSNIPNQSHFIHFITSIVNYNSMEIF